jgi:hypothetical protein
MSAATMLPSAHTSQPRTPPVPLTERVNPWLFESQQDLDHLTDVVAAEIGEAQTVEQEMRLRYALWLLWQARDTVESIEALLSADHSGVRKREP